MRDIRRRSRFSSLLYFATLMLGFFLTIGNVIAKTKTEPPPLSALSVEKRTELEGMLTQKLQQEASNNPYYTQRATGPLSVKLDPQTEDVIVDVGASFGPDSDGLDMQELSQVLDNIVWFTLKEVADYRGFAVIYGGKDMYHYHPEEWHPPVTRPVRSTTSNNEGATIQDTNSTIVVSAGHGLFKIYNDAGDIFSWVYQRPEVNYIQEDLITLDLAKQLKDYLPLYSEGVTVELTRPGAHGSIAPPGSTYWERYAARYHLEATYPDHPEIWHSRPDDTSIRREYLEDINSRPLFANHIGAAAIVHLHTNALANPSANGARAYFAQDSVESEKLADNLLCGMREALGANDAYQNFQVDSKSRPSTGYGENNKANMPSALLEVGFHTNPDDAVLLRTFNFKEVAMRGVAKGYWLYSLGKTCQPFEVDSVPDMEGPQNNKEIPAIINVHGFPRTSRKDSFEISALVEPVSCPIDVTCGEAWVTASGTQLEGPYQYRHSCTGPGTEPFVARYRVTLKDVDGVRTSPVEYNLTCQPPGPPIPGNKRSISVLDYWQ